MIKSIDIINEHYKSIWDSISLWNGRKFAV